MKKVLLQSAILLALALAATGLSALFHPLRPPWFQTGHGSGQDPWNLSPAEAADLVTKEGAAVLWVDARDRTSYEGERVPGAILLDPAEKGDLLFEHRERLQEAKFGDQIVVVYGDGESAEGSREIAELLREQLGLDMVFVLDGDWRELGIAR